MYSPHILDLIIFELCFFTSTIKMRFSTNSMTLLLALAAVAPTAIQAMLSNECKSDLADMYDMSSLTYQTIHDPSVMASMIHKLTTAEGSVYYTFNENQEALTTFQETCQGYNLPTNATAISSTNSTKANPYTTMVMGGGRVSRLSLMRSCTEDYNIGLPACVPTSCGTDDESDAEIATSLSDLFSKEDCVSVYLPTRTGESITSACLADVVNTTSPAMTMAGCEMNTNTTAIDVSFEHICGGHVKHVMDGVYCVPSNCESSEAVSELFKGHLVKITPYMDTMEMSNGTVNRENVGNKTGTGNETGNETGSFGNETVPVAECEWLYKDPSFVLRNGTDVDIDVDTNNTDTNNTDTSTNITIGDVLVDEVEDDCEEYFDMTKSSKSSENSSSKANKAKKGKSTAATSAPSKTSKKTKSSCKKSAKGGSLRRTPKVPRPSIGNSDLKIRSWNPLNLN